MDDLKNIFKIFGTHQPAPQTQFRVWYFEGLYGRGEPLRLLLTHANQVWEDVNVKMADWAHLKAMLPGGTLPLLEAADGSVKGGATRAVVRWLSHKFGYYPEDPMAAQ